MEHGLPQILTGFYNKKQYQNYGLLVSQEYLNYLVVWQSEVVQEHHSKVRLKQQVHRLLKLNL
jgi:hypothetical protein